jgi:hypothetical protein
MSGQLPDLGWENKYNVALSLMTWQVTPQTCRSAVQKKGARVGALMSRFDNFSVVLL